MGWFITYIIYILVFHIIFSAILPTSFTSTSLYTVFLLFIFPACFPSILGLIVGVLKQKRIINSVPFKAVPNKHLFLTLVAMVFFALFAISWAFGSLLHEHEWLDATCTEPRTCSSCHETEGEPLWHKWKEATCTSSKTCQVCRETEGPYADHRWVSATCTEPERCGVCGKKRHWYSLSLTHDWVDATCTTPKTCSRCGVAVGEPQHYFISYYWETTIEPTCQKEGEKSHACKLCGEVEVQTIPIVDCQSGDWEIVQTATSATPGTRVRRCTMCGQELEREQYTAPVPGTRVNGNGGSGSNFNTYNNESQQNTSASYVLNTSTMKFHYPHCRDVSKISPSNYATSNTAREDLISRGYSACGHCHP